MKSILKSILLIPIVFLFFSFNVFAQDDCCGFGSVFGSLLQSGIFGGYGIQQYSPKGLNDFLADYNTETGLDFNDFGTAFGWRVGANIIQLRHDDWLIGVKLYFQSVTEAQDQDGTYQGEDATQEFEMEIDRWGFGMSFSYILNNNFDVRIFDALLTINDITFTNTIKSSNAPPQDEFTNETGGIGFSADAGIVWYPLPPYLSIEVLGGYSFFSIETVRDYDYDNFPTGNEDFIDGGGFFACAVLTVGIPFN